MKFNPFRRQPKWYENRYIQALGASALVIAATGYQIVFNRGYKKAVEDCGGHGELLREVLFDENGNPRPEAAELISQIVKAEFVTQSELDEQKQEQAEEAEAPAEPAEAEKAA